MRDWFLHVVIFRNGSSKFLGCFAENLGICHALGAIKAIELANE
jgi:hypothetical protein